MTFGDLYESVEDIDIRVVDGEKSYYARVTNREFDYDAIVGREIERIYVDVSGNLVAELKYKPVLMVKDLLSSYVSNKYIKVVWALTTQYTRKERCIEIYGSRNVKSWNCDKQSISIMIDGEISTEL